MQRQLCDAFPDRSYDTPHHRQTRVHRQLRDLRLSRAAMGVFALECNGAFRCSSRSAYSMCAYTYIYVSSRVYIYIHIYIYKYTCIRTRVRVGWGAWRASGGNSFAPRSWLHARTFKCTATARRDRCCFQCAVQLSVHSGFAIGALLAMPSCGQARAFQR